MKSKEEIIEIGLGNINKFKKENDIFELIKWYSEVKLDQYQLDIFFEKGYDNLTVTNILNEEIGNDLTEWAILSDNPNDIISDVLDRFLFEISDEIIRRINNLKHKY